MATALTASWRRRAGQRATRMLSTLPQHRDSPHNNSDTPWAWTAESQAAIKKTLAKYPSN